MNIRGTYGVDSKIKIDVDAADFIIYCTLFLILPYGYILSLLTLENSFCNFSNYDIESPRENPLTWPLWHSWNKFANQDLSCESNNVNGVHGSIDVSKGAFLHLFIYII